MQNRSSSYPGQRCGMTARAAVTGALLWCAVIITGVLLWNQPDDSSAPQQSPTDDPVPPATDADEQSGGESPPENRQTISLPPRKVPEFTLEECMGEDFGLADLEGKPWVVSFIFTRCITTCPQITLAMKDLHNRVAEHNPDVMFVTMTVDSDYDNATILQRYSETFQPDRDRWKFLTGDMQEMHSIIVDGFGVYVKENVGDARRPGMEVAHSNRVVLVNEDSFPVGKYLGTNPEQMADLAKILMGRKPFPDPLPPLQFSTSGGAPPGVDIQLVPVEATEDQSSDEEPADKELLDEGLPDAGAADSADTPESTPDQQEGAGSTVRERLQNIDRLLPSWAKALPTANAILNSTATVLLTLGWLAIRGGRQDIHRNLMISAFVVSVAFLGCYLTSHWALNNYADERGRPFAGGSAARAVYYVILWPHVALAATVPFFAIRVFQHAAAARWEQHRRLARIALPIWMYVSVTGVAIYGMLYHWPQAV